MNRNQTHINFSLQIIIVFLFIFLLGSGTMLQAQSDEQTMKAVALEKLSLFISWPENTPSKEFVICVLNQNPLGDILEDVYKDKKIKDKKVKIVKIKNLQELTECQLLLIPTINKSELNKVLNYVKGKPILTISDSEGFAEAGCFINFYEYENKLRFEINQKSMENAGFKIDYRLLKVSKVINPVIE